MIRFTCSGGIHSIFLAKIRYKMIINWAQERVSLTHASGLTMTKRNTCFPPSTVEEGEHRGQRGQHGSWQGTRFERCDDIYCRLATINGGFPIPISSILSRLHIHRGLPLSLVVSSFQLFVPFAKDGAQET